MDLRYTTIYNYLIYFSSLVLSENVYFIISPFVRFLVYVWFFCHFEINFKIIFKYTEITSWNYKAATNFHEIK